VLPSDSSTMSFSSSRRWVCLLFLTVRFFSVFELTDFFRVRGAYSQVNPLHFISWRF
jgi:hypothetical protein